MRCTAHVHFTWPHSLICKAIRGGAEVLTWLVGCACEPHVTSLFVMPVLSKWNLQIGFMLCAL